VTFSSLTLTKLCIHVHSFDDCLVLLDGRLKQLTKFIVEVDYIYNSTSLNTVSLCSMLLSFSTYEGTYLGVQAV
jgi:hypothetical protein